MRIKTHTADNVAMILLADGVLIGVLSELFDKCHGLDRGKWIIEAAFGNDERPNPVTFPSATEAANWLGFQIAGGGKFNLDGQVPELR